MIHFRPTHGGFRLLACGLFVAGVATLLFVDPSFAQEAAPVALVLMMTIPGLGLFYGGMVRKKNVGDTVMTSFAITCLVTVLYAVVTYSLAFRAGTPFIGGVGWSLLEHRM